MSKSSATPSGRRTPFSFASRCANATIFSVGARRVLTEVGEVRQHEVDSEMLVTREGETRIDEQPLAPDLVQRHVLADLAEPAERDDA